ncbi:LysR substrate-binding domain-containing protein [Enterobacter asburiae]|nr:LysR substrate-binding domain-containing protein [Enterobacter asburiae]MCK7285209.1 LysR substrate-binding domain-containing protein [Enterobacter asburiae]MEB5763591.1 LysR substrate-binding domain-containing protein [Enterobacter asburiae]
MIERSAASFSSGATGLRGVVRVAASEIIGTEVLPSVIAQIKDAYPQITVELVLSETISVTIAAREKTHSEVISIQANANDAHKMPDFF